MNEESYNPVAKAVSKLTEDLIRVAASEGVRADRQVEEGEKEAAEFITQKRELGSRLTEAEKHRALLLVKMREIQSYLVTVKQRIGVIHRTSPGPGKRTKLRKVMEANLPDAVIEIDTCLRFAKKGIDGPDREF